MTVIRFDDSDGRISVEAEGHAGYAPKGHDIVCAAVSTLMITLASQVITLKEQGCFREEPEIKLQDGAAVIRCNPKWRYKRMTKQFFEMIEGGCLMIEMDHRGCINVSTFEGGTKNGN